MSVSVEDGVCPCWGKDCYASEGLQMHVLCNHNKVLEEMPSYEKHPQLSTAIEKMLSWFCFLILPGNLTAFTLVQLRNHSDMYRVPSTPVRQPVKFLKRCSPGCESGHVWGILQLLSELFPEYFSGLALRCEHHQGPYLLLLMAFAGSSSSVNLRWFLPISLLPTGLRGAAGNWLEACSLHSAAAWQSH